MEATKAYVDIFPEIFNKSFVNFTTWYSYCGILFQPNQMKLIITRLRSRISDINLARLLRISIEGPEPNNIDFNEIIDVFEREKKKKKKKE